MYAFIYLMDLIYLNHRYFGYSVLSFSPMSLNMQFEACLYNRYFSVIHLCHWSCLLRSPRVVKKVVYIPAYLFFTCHSVHYSLIFQNVVSYVPFTDTLTSSLVNFLDSCLTISKRLSRYASQIPLKFWTLVSSSTQCKMGSKTNARMNLLYIYLYSET